MATRADVARFAGVSESTVSYVLSGKRKISAKTSERVQAAMAALGYTPNAIATGLAGGRTTIVAWHFPVGTRRLSLTEFEYVYAATQAAGAAGRHLLLWTGEIADAADLERLTATQLIDGIILTEIVADDPRIELLQATGIPFALVGRPADPGDLTYVDADFDEIGRMAVEHLHELGHRRIAMLADDAEPLRVGYSPLLRLGDALRRWSAVHEIELTMLSGGSTVAQGRALGCSPDFPSVTAVLGLNPMTLVGVMEGRIARGVRIPADLSFLALGVSESTAMLTRPHLTTVFPSGEEIGRHGVHLLEEVIDGTGARQVLVPAQIHIGASTGPAATTR